MRGSIEVALLGINTSYSCFDKKKFYKSKLITFYVRLTMLQVKLSGSAKNQLKKRRWAWYNNLISNFISKNQ